MGIVAVPNTVFIESNWNSLVTQHLLLLRAKATILQHKQAHNIAHDIPCGEIEVAVVQQCVSGIFHQFLTILRNQPSSTGAIRYVALNPSHGKDNTLDGIEAVIPLDGVLLDCETRCSRGQCANARRHAVLNEAHLPELFGRVGCASRAQGFPLSWLLASRNATDQSLCRTLRTDRRPRICAVQLRCGAMSL